MLLRVSLALNVLLTAWALFARMDSDEIPAKTRANATTFSDAPEETFGAQPMDVSEWHDLDAGSPAELARRLRDIGCPEHFVQNAVVAQIDRAFAARREALATIEDFWLTHDARKSVELERRLELLALTEERRRTIEETLGIDWSLAPSKRWIGQKRTSVKGFYYGFLPPDRMAKAVAVYEKAEIHGDELDAVSGALTDEEMIEFRKSHYAAFESSIAKVLTSSERERAERWMYGMYLFDVWKSERQFGRDLSHEERDEMLAILKPPDYAARSFSLPLESAYDEELRAEREAAMRERFGEEVVDHYRKFTEEVGLDNQVFPIKR
ncbi:MAG: hypothetical protein ACI9R3_005069 [Verrucomicrobiales bacterium]|jgi:hypothetical protein